MKRLMLTQPTPYLSNFLDDKIYMYSNVRCQETDSAVNTCGSHVVNRICRWKHYNMDMNAYSEFMSELNDDYGNMCDTIVAKFIDRCFVFILTFVVLSIH